MHLAATTGPRLQTPGMNDGGGLSFREQPGITHPARSWRIVLVRRTRGSRVAIRPMRPGFTRLTNVFLRPSGPVDAPGLWPHSLRSEARATQRLWTWLPPGMAFTLPEKKANAKKKAT